MRFATFVLYSLWSGMAGAAPFGIDINNFSLEAHECALVKMPFYKCINISKPHKDIESYIIKHIEGVGICMIKGISFDFNDSNFGFNTRAKVDEIHNQLETKYGSGKKFDLLIPGSIWDEPEDWAMAVLKEERIYAHLWELSPPIEDVEQIALAGNMSNRDTGYFSLEFHMPNKEACDKAEKTLGASSF